MRSLNNFRAEQPHQHAMYYLRLLMTEVAWTKDELREALDGERPPPDPPHLTKSYSSAGDDAFDLPSQTQSIMSVTCQTAIFTLTVPCVSLYHTSCSFLS